MVIRGKVGKDTASGTPVVNGGVAMGPGFGYGPTFGAATFAVMAETGAADQPSLTGNATLGHKLWPSSPWYGVSRLSVGAVVQRFGMGMMAAVSEKRDDELLQRLIGFEVGLEGSRRTEESLGDVEEWTIGLQLSLFLFRNVCEKNGDC